MSDSKVTGNQRFLEFTLGEESYAVELLRVREVITPPELTPIPKAPAHVLGLMNLRGLVLTVVDLRKKMGIQPHADQSQGSVIIFDLEDRLVGCQVDSIQRVVTVPLDTVKPVPESEISHISQNLKGIIQSGEKLMLWLDVQRLLAPTPIPQIKAA